MSKWVYISIALVMVLIAGSGLTFEFFYLKKQAGNLPQQEFATSSESQQIPKTAEASPIKKPTETLTPEALLKCFPRVNDLSFTDTCVHTTVSTLLLQMTPRELLAYTVASTTPVNVNLNCHAIAHIVGEEVYKKSKTLETALAECSESCRSGCIHGVIGTSVLEQMGQKYAGDDIVHADNETIARIGKPYCEKSASFCHAMGHILYIANENDSKAADVCGEISSGFRQEACRQGVFMEHAGNGDALEPFQKNSSYGVAPDGDATYPCLQVAPQYRHACLQYLSIFQVPLYKKNGITATSSQVAFYTKTCESLPEKERSFCFEGVGPQSMLAFDMSFEALQIFCNSLPTLADRSACTLGSVVRFASFSSRPLRLCRNIPSKDAARGKLCFYATFNLLERNLQTTDANLICPSNNPDTAVCTEQYKAYLSVKSTLPDYRLGMWGGK